MIDRDKALKGLEALDKAMSQNQCYTCSHEFIDAVEEFGTNIIEDTIALLKTDKSERLQFIEGTAKLVVENEMLKKQLADRPEIVRCKDCVHRGKSEKCVLSAISEEKDVPLFMLDNRGYWFCADGVTKDNAQE